MVNWDKNVQGAVRDQRRKAFEEKQKAKEEKQQQRIEENKRRQAEARRASLQAIVADLKKSEEEAYLPIFDVLSSSGPVSPTDPALLKFLVQHTDISLERGVEGLVQALKEVTPGEDEPLSFSDFMRLLRDNACADCTVIPSFLDAGNGLDFVALVEAKAYLLHLAQSKVSLSISKEEWYTVLEGVLAGSEATLGLQDYIKYGGLLSRSARLLRFLEHEALSFMTGDIEDKELVKAGSADETYWDAVSERVSCALAGRDLPCPVVVLKKERSSEDVKAPSNNDETASELAGGRKEDDPDDGLPAVARRCALCINCGGLCETHAKFGRRRRRMRAPSSSAPEDGGAAPPASSLPGGGGSSSSSSSSARGPGVDEGAGCGTGRSGGAASAGAASAKCDLCKASGGLCVYHARAGARRPAAAGACGATSSGGSTASGSSSGGSRSACSSVSSACGSVSSGSGGSSSGSGASGSGGSGGGGGGVGGSKSSSSSSSGSTSGPPERPVDGAACASDTAGVSGVAHGDVGARSVAGGDIARRSCEEVGGRGEGSPSGIRADVDSFCPDGLRPASSRTAASEGQVPAQPPDAQDPKEKATKPAKRASKAKTGSSQLRKAKVELEAALLANDPSRLEDAILAGADAGMDEEELLPAFEAMEALLGR